MVKHLIALMAVPPVLLYCAYPAKADNNGFLGEIHAINASHGTSDMFMVGLGEAVCLDLNEGATIYDIEAAITDSPNSPFTAYEGAEIIYASVDQICPRFMPVIMRQAGATNSTRYQ